MGRKTSTLCIICDSLKRLDDMLQHQAYTVNVVACKIAFTRLCGEFEYCPQITIKSYLLWCMSGHSDSVTYNDIVP